MKEQGFSGTERGMGGKRESKVSERCLGLGHRKKRRARKMESAWYERESREMET